MKQGTNRFFSFRTAMTLLLALMTTITAWAYDIKTHITYKGLTASNVTFTLSGNGVNFELKDGETKSVGNIFPYADFTISCSSTLSLRDVSYSGAFIPEGGPSFKMNSENGCSFRWTLAELELTLNICVSSSDLPVYTVHFDPNTMFVFGSMNDQIIESGVPTPLSPCTFENGFGLNFCGWNTAANGSGESFADGASVTDIAAAGEAITLYAQWKDESTFINCNIHFNANGGTGSMTDQSIAWNNSMPLTANTFTRDGYTFVGWNTEADGSGMSYSNQQSISPTSDMTLYAQWCDNTHYFVHFDKNDGLVTGSMDDQTFTVGVAQKLRTNAFTNINPLFTFKGWNTKADGSGISYTNQQSVTDIIAGGQSITLYAQWQSVYSEGPSTSHEIHFNANGGTGSMTDQSIPWQNSMPLTANTFTRDGYTFVGWNTKADGSGTSYANQQSIYPTSDMTLYAQWQELTPLTQGGSINMPTSGTKYVEIPSNVTKFYVYDDGGSNGNFSNNCDGKILLVAPVGKMLKVGGSVKAGTDGGFIRQMFGLLNVYDGSSTSDNRLLSYSNGSFSNIVSSDRKMLLHFYDDKMVTKTAEGISLTVEVVEPERNQIIIDSNISHGTVTVDKTAATTGETVTLTVTPTVGYELSYFTGVKTTSIGNNQYTFLMPDEDVTISAVFRISSLLGTYRVGTFYFIPDGSAASPYVINSTAGWNLFCDCLEDVDTWNYFRGKTVKLGADIEVSRVAGSSGHDFSGTFDGDGHKLTVNLTGTGNYTAPFYYLKPQSDDESVTIRGLKVDGTINTANKYAGGLVGGCHGKVNIIDCVSDVTINSSVSGDGTHGGLVGRMASSGTLSFDGCAFTGKMLTTNGTANCGGFLGWTVGTVNINNCLYAPAAMEDGETEVGSSESKAFARLNNTAVMNINNSFYTRTLGTAQGIQARSTATLPSNIGEAGEDYRFVKAYAKGLKCNDLYYMVPEALTLANASANDVESISGYFADVTLADRSLTKDGTWNTLCLPFSLSAEQIEGSPLAGAVIKEMDSSTSLNDGLLTLNFKNAQSIEAGKAYIVKWETKGENIANPVFSGVTISNAALVETESTDGKVKFVGQYSPFAIDNDNIHEILFIGSGNKIGYSKNPRSLKSCRAHFWVQPNGNSASARVINLDLGDGMTTRIDLVEAKEDSNSESGMYTLDGRKLQNEPTQKGVYIKNGKKIIK